MKTAFRILRSLSFTLLFLSCMAAANPYNDQSELIRPENLVGSGKLTWWGFTVYKASLYAASRQYSPDLGHALKIEYEFSFSREQLAKRSVEEMEEIYGGLPAREQIYRDLVQAMPSVEEGDVITGIHEPRRGAKFFLNDKLVGELGDPDTAGKFFAIWLDPKTSQPDLRLSLMGKLQ